MHLDRGFAVLRVLYFLYARALFDVARVSGRALPEFSGTYRVARLFKGIVVLVLVAQG